MRRGIALSEIIALITAFGIVVLVLIPGLGRRILVTKERKAKANLAALRAALVLHQRDQGAYPSDLQALAEGARYLGGIPAARIPGRHWDSAKISSGGSATALNDAGGWAYVNDSADKNFGSVWINCTHTDSAGVRWNSY